MSRATSRGAALGLLALGLLAGTPAAAAEPPVRTSGAYAPLPGYQRMDPALEKRLAEASARIEALSRAMRAAIGDPGEYARLRADHAAAVAAYDAVSRIAHP